MAEPAFPVLLGFGKEARDYKGPRSVPWSLLLPYESRAIRNHDQSLRRLAERGGLSPCEMVCILEDARPSAFFFGGTRHGRGCTCVSKLEAAIERERAAREGG